MTLCKESAGSLVVFSPPKANTPRLHEHAHAHTILRKYHFNQAKKRIQICVGKIRVVGNCLIVFSEGQQDASFVNL